MQMRATDITNDVARLAGIDRRTAKKALEGKPVHRLVREAVARALSDLAGGAPATEARARNEARDGR